MIIRGIDFKFSTLNANDVDRMLTAQKKQQERAKAEGSRYTPDGEGYPAFLRFQCSIFMDYLEEVLGAGACEKLGLDGSNFNECLAVSKDFAEAMAAEKAAVNDLLHPKKEEDATASNAIAMPAPMNREQRRAATKAQRSAAIALPSENSARAADKDARRKQLLKELAELENV